MKFNIADGDNQRIVEQLCSREIIYGVSHLITELAKLGTDIGDYRSEEFYDLCSQQYSAEEIVENSREYGVKELPDGGCTWWHKDDELEPYTSVFPEQRIAECPGGKFISYALDLCPRTTAPYEDIEDAVVEKNGMYYAKLRLPSTNVVHAGGGVNTDDYFLSVGPYLTYREALRVVWDVIICDDQKSENPSYRVFDSYAEAVTAMWKRAVEDGSADVRTFNTEEEACEDCVEENGLSRDEYHEVYEHWIVTDWFGKKLGERGQVVKEVLGLTVWGRSCTGQSCALDYVMWDIAYDMEILKGMKYDWSAK